MIRLGRSARWLNEYIREVDFSKKAGFDFHQVWYDRRGISLTGVSEPKEDSLPKFEFPYIIHALLDISEFDDHIYTIREITKKAKTNEVIIHPVCKSEKITSDTIVKLSDAVKSANSILREQGITLFVENNSKIDPINHSIEEVKYLFESNPEIEFLLDIAHILSYKHLEDLVAVKMPKKLHIADKRFHIPHEHLPIGKGNIDFAYVFSNVLRKFSGDIIFEIVEDDDLVIESKKAIIEILERCHMI
jgi:sugar phosphate isomerase/epimerase